MLLEASFIFNFFSRISDVPYSLLFFTLGITVILTSEGNSYSSVLKLCVTSTDIISSSTIRLRLKLFRPEFSFWDGY